MSSLLRHIVPFASTLALVVCASACSNDSKSNDAGMKDPCQLGPACLQISMACMPKDLGTAGPIHDCHIAGMETGDEAKCESMLSSCVTTCNSAPGFGDAGGFMLTCEGGMTTQ